MLNLKILISSIVLIFLVSSFVSAADIDNVKTYNSTTNTVTITNLFGFGSVIARATLNTSQHAQVHSGNDVLVGQFNLEVMAEYENGLQNLYVYNLNNNNLTTTEKPLKYKRGAVSGYNSVSTYNQNCTVSSLGNASVQNLCYPFINGSRQEPVYTWTEMTSGDLNAGNYTIGIFTDVLSGEYVEWIPKMFGLTIGEWADFQGYTQYERFMGVINLDQGFGGNTSASNVSLGMSMRVGITGPNDTMIQIRGFSVLLTSNDTTATLMSARLYNFNLTTHTPGSLIGQNNSINISTLPVGPRGGTLQGMWFNVSLNGSTTGGADIVLILSTPNGATLRWQVNDSVSSSNPSYPAGNQIRQQNGTDSWGNDTNLDLAFQMFGGNQALDGTVNLLTPTNDTSTTSTAMNFSAVGTTVSGNFTNATLEVWFANNNTIFVRKFANATGNTVNVTNFTVQVIPLGSFKWNVKYTVVNSTDQVIVRAPANFTFTVTSITQNNNTYNGTTYETARESFATNITLSAGLNLSTAVLFWNGTLHNGYVQNPSTNLWAANTSFDIPLGNGSKTFYWQLNFSDGSSTDQSASTQNVSSLNLSICDATNTVPFINFTFKDEVTSSYINAGIDSSSWVYYLGSGSVNKTLSYSNSSQLPSFAFCVTPPDRPLNTILSSLKYSATNYPQRTYSFTLLSLSNATRNDTLYLLSSSTGIYSSVIVVQGLGTTGIEGAQVLIEAPVGDSYVTVFSGLTDSAGVATAWLNPNTLYRYSVSAEGFIPQQFFLNPSQTTYTVRLQSISDVTNPYNSSLTGYKWYVQPMSGVIPVANINFNLTLVNTIGDLYACRFSLVNQSNSAILNTTSGGSAYYCNLSITYTTHNAENYFLRLEINNSNTAGTFQVIDTDWKLVTIDTQSTTGTDIVSFFRLFRSINSFGGDTNRAEFSRIMFFFLISTIVLSLFCYTTSIEIQNPGVLLFIGFFVIAIASYAGFFTFTVANSNIGTWEEQYGILFIYGMFALGYMFNQLRRQS